MKKAEIMTKVNGTFNKVGFQLKKVGYSIGCGLLLFFLLSVKSCNQLCEFVQTLYLKSAYKGISKFYPSPEN